ncbi:MAG: DUF1552 domain-containing protein [Deltaproteobacteria bacterium]|nr:DUF1552 domain-containing protein [Deltaproteobacteria bacterium]
MKRINRRTVLRGLGGVVVPLPLLDIMARTAPARAESSITKTGPNGAPKRFIVFFTPCGQGADWLRCTNDAQGKLVLSAAMQPLQRHKDQLMVLDGINNKSALFDAASIDPGHQKPMVNLMTCLPSNNGLGGGISIDQAIAKEISTGTKFPSVQLGVQPNGGFSGALSYSAARVPIPPIGDPKQAFTRLFSDLNTDQTTFAKLNADRKSILDGIKEDFSGLAQKLSGDDRMKIESHLDGIREVESRLVSSNTTSCLAPTAPAAGGTGADGLIAAGDAYIKLLATALACDLTRVASIMYQGSGGNPQLPGMPKGIHDASHDYGALGWPVRNQYTSWFAGRFAMLMDLLKAADEGGRSVLDNTVIYWCSEHGAGNHNYDWMPILVAGSGGGYFKTGRQIKYPNLTDGLNYVQYNAGSDKATGPSQADLYVSFMNAMGISANTFGVASQCKGALPNLTV